MRFNGGNLWRTITLIDGVDVLKGGCYSELNRFDVKEMECGGVSALKKGNPEEEMQKGDQRSQGTQKMVVFCSSVQKVELRCVGGSPDYPSDVSWRPTRATN